MTQHEQLCLNDATDKVKAFEWRDRTIARLLLHKLQPLGPGDKIALLQKIDEMLS